MTHIAALKLIFTPKQPSQSAHAWWAGKQTCQTNEQPLADLLLTHDSLSNLTSPIEKPKVERTSTFTGDELRQLFNIEYCESIDIGALLYETIINPILIIDNKHPSLTGDIARSKELISKLNPEIAYPVLWVSSSVLAPKPPQRLQKPASKKTPVINKYAPKMSKGDLERQEAAALGISAAALRKRRSRAKAKARLNNEKK